MYNTRWIKNNIPASDCAKSLSLMDVGTIRKVREFHRSFPQYSVTPLVALGNLAGALGVGGIYVKDESYRFGLNSFKALGCTFALASFIAQTIGCSVWDLDYGTLTSPDMKSRLGEYTFFATTDGNHGRALAWAASQIGQKSVIYMPKGCPLVRLENIRREGAEAYITDSNYDDTIRFTAELADKTPGGVIVQDTAWEGYEDIPGWIMQGYGVMALEACDQLREMGVMPTHMLIQAGVGAFAGSAQGLVSNYYGADSPVTFVVEPIVADCHYRSAQKGDGSIVNVGGDMDTIMAGLACGEPNILSWDILKNKSSYFVSIEDEIAARGMRVLGAPLRGDPRVISGESGASSMGFLTELLTSGDSSMAELREQAGIGKDSRILVFSTEGDTDPENYRRIVWDGKLGVKI
ncbi:MAG: diaminopropionate ammonia-lyase [Oscillospiraceae bacterium]|nr:diaminopropionate ammonia-lyase [Oscillospiraceae bacterium]